VGENQIRVLVVPGVNMKHALIAMDMDWFQSTRQLSGMAVKIIL